MIASPIYLSMIPRWLRIGRDIVDSWWFITLTRPFGVMPSLRPVNPFMSQTSTVITRRSPSLDVRDFGSISPSTTRGVDIPDEGFA
jgi:hypothetical protein